jgi:putative transposase
MIEPKHPKLPIVRQCELLGLARASYYHQPEPEPAENLRLMRVIDETYLAHPEFGSRQMTRWLRLQGHRVNRKRIRRLMQQMSLEAIYQKPNTSRRHPEHRAYRYLLRHLRIERSNHVWAADITYVPIKGGFIYLFAVIDWSSRAPGSCRTRSMRASACGPCNVRCRSTACRKSSTPIKAASSPPPNLPSRCSPWA